MFFFFITNVVARGAYSQYVPVMLVVIVLIVLIVVTGCCLSIYVYMFLVASAVVSNCLLVAVMAVVAVVKCFAF